MTGERHPYSVGRISMRESASLVRSFAVFASMTEDELEMLGECERLEVPADGTLFDPEHPLKAYCLLLEGEVAADRVEQDGSVTRLAIARAGECFGEVLLLSGKVMAVRVLAAQPSRILCVDEDQFWRMMACCPTVRKAVLADSGKRQHAYQIEALHREKLISLGTLAAGLMHELHNPGSAAKRAASQLRENMLRLQELSLHFCDREVTPNQLACMRNLQQEAIGHAHSTAMSTIEQMDAEETMGAWLEQAGVENAYRIAPQLVSMGLSVAELQCTRQAFPEEGLSDALNWLESLVSSVCLVDAIEQSVTRVSDLVMAVKKFAYDDRCSLRKLDVHDSIQSTLTILGHKLRHRGIEIVKQFDAGEANLQTSGVALSQVWTNLLDNAIDASPESGVIEVHTWNEPGYLAVGVTDHGAGIPEEVRDRIFEPFFTTKPVGKGTGLGLEIAHRIVTQNFGGKLEFATEAGRTEFIVRLPRANATATTCTVC